jgi:hypothetical protein
MMIYVNVGSEKPISFAISGSKQCQIMRRTLSILADGPTGGMTVDAIVAQLDVSAKDDLGYFRLRQTTYLGLRRMNEARFIHKSKDWTPRLVHQRGGVTDKNKIWTITDAGRLALADLQQKQAEAVAQEA